MVGVRLLVLVASVVVLAQSTCCCCSWLPEPPPTPEVATEADDPEVERVARERAARDSPTLLVENDAGATRSGCLSALGALALDLGVAVITRGHAGGDASAQVTFDPAACARRIVVHVVKRAGVFVAVAVVVLDRLSGAELARSGDVPAFEPTPDPGLDLGSDELF